MTSVSPNNTARPNTSQPLFHTCLYFFQVPITSSTYETYPPCRGITKKRSTKRLTHATTIAQSSQPSFRTTPHLETSLKKTKAVERAIVLAVTARTTVARDWTSWSSVAILSMLQLRRASLRRHSIPGIRFRANFGRKE